MREVARLDEFEASTNVWFYNAAPELNKFATRGSEFAKVSLTKNPQVWIKIAETDISRESVTVQLKGVELQPTDRLLKQTGNLTVPLNAQVTDSNCTAYTLLPRWDKVAAADYYEIEFE